MEVTKNKRNQEKFQTSRTSRRNGGVNKTDLGKGKEICQSRDTTRHAVDNKRKSLKRNNGAVSHPKHLKGKEMKHEGGATAQKNNNNVSNPCKNAKNGLRTTLGGKGKGTKTTQRNESNKTIAATPKPRGNDRKEVPEPKGNDRKEVPKPKANDRKEVPKVKEEKLHVKGGVKTDGRKRKIANNGDGVVTCQGDRKTKQGGTSPEKIKKVEKEVKNATIKKTKKCDGKGKASSSSRKVPAKRTKTKEKVKESPAPILEVNANDPLAMLMMMEGVQAKGQGLTGGPARESSSGDEMDDSDGSDLSDMEDVKDYSLPVEEERSQIPSGPVEITLDMPDILNKRRKKKEFDWKKHLEKRVRKFKKDVAINIHKSHILCLVALGLRQNRALNDETVRGVCVSLIPSHLATSATSCLSTQRVVDSAMSWYRNTFPLNQVTHTSGLELIPAHSIVSILSKNSITDARVWAYLFICVLRTLGLSVRLVLSLQPIPFKVSDTSNETTSSSSSSKSLRASKGSKKKTATKTTTSSSLSPSQKLSSSITPIKSSSSPLSSKPGKTCSPSTSCTKSSSSSTKKPKPPSSSGRRSPSVRRSSLDARTKSQQDLKEEEEGEDCNQGGKKGKEAGKKTKPGSDDRDDSDSDFEATSPYFGQHRQELKVKSNRKILSDDDEDKQGRAHDFWLEVFMKGTSKWMCFDCFRDVYDKPYSLENKATQPVTYVVAFRNDDGVKDVTARYTKQWFSVTRKARVDSDWLEHTFGVFGKASYQEAVMEEDQIKGQLMVRPMPSSIGEFKSHPLYALRRHLLKFEAIYPDTAIPLAYIRKEPVYARECVHTLHSRDNWLKEGRLVRLKEEPYKMVKSRPKWNKPKENPEELDLELYGKWQTEKFIPLPAVNGKVPKNAYGNVELFKPWMLPSGTVQLKLQGLQRVAKKLDIDVAPAMVGWDHHSGHAHPVFDGFIVCEEFADTLLDAWDEDQEIQKQKEDEKRDKRVYGNWRLLIRGLLIRERLTNKFLKAPPDLMMDGADKQDSEVPSTSNND